MSFNYNKSKDHGQGDSFWTSYSDLFLGLSTIFLLLYVTASLRTGTDGIKNMIENQRLTMKVQDLESQIKMYESIKTDYLQNQAAKGEVQEYRELMDKLSLLQEEARDEKERLKQEAMQNQSKEVALNKYQQMVRNIINANKMAKTKIISRNDIIDEQDTEMEVQDQRIDQLQTDIDSKRQKIEEGEREIAKANKILEKKMAEIKLARKRNKLTAKAYEKQMAKLKEQNENQVDALRDANEKYEKQVAQSESKLNSLSGQLQETTGKLAQKEGEAAALQQKVASMRGEFEAQQAKERAAFEGALQKEKLTGAERAKREGEFRAAAALKEQALANRIGQLTGQVDGLSGQVSGLSTQLKSTEGQLAKAKAEMDARKQVARDIKAGFEKAGVKADIDMQTGDVLIDFGQAYFESDSARLKPEMKDIIERAVPIYSKSLFGNPKVAEKISAVEVVGFASPTYQGKYIDPNSRKAQDREAIKYNMDLSYKRAKSIFNHILDERSMNFEHQREMVPMMKVSGRSFLEVFKANRDLASSQNFCKVNDCKKAQRVIIRFSMDGKK